ncbi:hypothetical protein BgiMline_000687, partial [Biomphalaria glabrata]
MRSDTSRVYGARMALPRAQRKQMRPNQHFTCDKNAMVELLLEPLMTRPINE